MDILWFFPSKCLVKMCVFWCRRKVFISSYNMCDLHQMIIYYIGKVICWISVRFDKDHIVKLFIRLCDISVNLIMECSLALIRHIRTNDKWLACCQIGFHFFFRKMQAVFIVYADFLSTYVLF